MIFSVVGYGNVMASQRSSLNVFKQIHVAINLQHKQQTSTLSNANLVLLRKLSVCVCVIA